MGAMLLWERLPAASSPSRIRDTTEELAPMGRSYAPKEVPLGDIKSL